MVMVEGKLLAIKSTKRLLQYFTLMESNEWIQDALMMWN